MAAADAHDDATAVVPKLDGKAVVSAPAPAEGFSRIPPRRSEFPLPPPEAARLARRDPRVVSVVEPAAGRGARRPSAMARAALLIVAVAGGTLANMALLVDESDRAWLRVVPYLAVALTFALLVVWSYLAVANARALAPPSNHVAPLDPWRVVIWWLALVPYSAVAVVAHELVTDRFEGDAREWASLGVLGAAIVVGWILGRQPYRYLGEASRRIGGTAKTFLQWFWIPLPVLAIGRLIAVIGFGAHLAAGEDTGGDATLVNVCLSFALPAALFVLLMYRATAELEDVIEYQATERWEPAVDHFKVKPGFVPPTGFSNALEHQRVQGTKRPLPGSRSLRLLIVTGLAGTALLSLVGALVMFLFWQQSADTGLLASEIDRAWTVVSRLRDVERVVALAVLALVVVWTFISATNARRVGRERLSPFPPAIAWAVAGAGIWLVGRAMVAPGGTSGEVALGYCLQAVILALPFLFLERVATSVTSPRTPIRISFVFALMLLVHIQGLGGLSTIDEVSDREHFGRLAGYLALGAVLQLLSTLAVTEACQSIEDGADAQVRQHGELVAQIAGSRPSAPLARA